VWLEEIRRLVAPRMVAWAAGRETGKSLRPRGMADTFAIDAFSRSPGLALSFLSPGRSWRTAEGPACVETLDLI
jgi:hypothetical protein